MGIEQLDYLFAQSQTMLGYLDSMNAVIDNVETDLTAIAGSLDTPASEIDNFNLDLEALIVSQDQLAAYIEAGETVNALGLVGNVKDSIGTAKNKIQTTKGYINSAKATFSSFDLTVPKATIGTAKDLVNVLIPLITTEIEKVAGDGKTYYNYKCSACSLGCTSRKKFKPPLEAVLKICDLKGDNSADYTFISQESIS
jgi:hypothetical protein